MLKPQRAGRMLLGASVGIVGAMALAANRGGNSRPPALDGPPGRTESAPQHPARDMTVRFQFDGVPYTDVVRQFAQASEKPLIGDLNIDGTLTFFDSEPYDYDQALDTLNLILGMKGFALREEGRFLRLRPLGEVVSSTRVLRGLEDADEKNVRPGEIVTVMVPLKFMDPNAAAKAIVRMVSSFGSVSPLAQGKGIIITDRLSNIRRVRQLLDSLDTGTLVDRQLKTYPLQNAQASVAADILKQLFGPTAAQKWVYDPEHNRLKPSPPDPRDVVTVSHDPRANIVVLVGTGDKLAMAEQMLQRLDQAETTTGDIRIFKLDKSRADQVAETLKQLVPNLKKKGSQAEATVVPDVATNRLLVAAPPEQMKRIEQVIRDLDTASEEKASVRIFELQHADPRQLVSAILNATGQRDLYGRVTHTLTASPLPDGRRLVVSGPSRDLEAAETLIRQLDTAPEDVQREVHVVQLESGDVGQVARTLDQLFTQQRGRRQRDETDPVVVPEYSSNSLFISVLPEDWPGVQKLLAKVQDTALKQATRVLKIYELEHTKAEQLAQTLQQAVRYRHYRRRGKLPILIVPSKRNNSLLVTATDADQSELASMIDMLDTPSQEKIDPVTMIRLQAAQADELARKLRDMLPEARGWQASVHIQADPSTNSVLLRAPDDQRDMIEKIIAQLDQATQTQARQTRIVQLQHVAGSAMASMLDRLYPHRRGMAEQQRVLVTPGPHDQSVVIEAPRPQMEEIVDMTASLDIRGGEDTFEVRTYDFEAGNVHEIARSLQRLFAQRWSRHLRSNVSSQPQPRFEVHSAGNQLLVAATPQQFAEIETIIDELKVKSQLATQTRTFRLKHARPDELAPVLQRMLQPERNLRRDQHPPRVMALDAADALIVKAAPEQLALAEQLIQSFDTAEASGQSVLQAVKLKNAQAKTLVDSVSRALRESGRRGWQNVTVTAESNSNSVLVRGPADEIEPVLAMIRELDDESVSEDVQIRIYPLKHSDARQLAQTFQAIFRDILHQQMWTRGRDSRAVPFSVAANERTNSLVVSTTPAYFKTVEQMLANLDSQDKSAREVEYVYLDHADAMSVARQLEDMFRDRRWSDRPVVQPDVDSNTLSIIGSDADLTMMQRVIAKLDQAAADRALRVRVVPLTGVPAERMAEMIQRIYGQMNDVEVVVTDRLPRVAPESKRTPSPAVVPPADTDPQDDHRSNAAPPAGADRPATTPVEAPAETADLADSAPASQPEPPAVDPTAPALDAKPDKTTVTIAVDTQANVLLINGPRRDIDEIETLIGELTFSSASEAEFRTFKLQRADPSEIARTLDELFNPKTPRVVGKKTLPPKPVITAVPEPRTRSVIVRAKPLEFEVIEPLIQQMDRVSTTISEVRIFAMKNADAPSVARNLRDLFSADAPRGGRRSPQGKRQDMVNRLLQLRGKDGQTSAVEISADISIQANSGTNSVVVSAPADAMDLITRLVEELDQSGAETTRAVVRMYPLKQAEVHSTVAALQQLFAQPRQGRRQRNAAPEVPVVVTGDEQGRLVIVSAAPEQQEIIQQVLTDLERSQGRRELYVRVYPLENAQANAVASALSETLTRQRARRGPKAQDAAGLRISAEPSNNSIVALADEPTHQRIETLIERMDASKLASQPVRMIPLQHADPQRLADMLGRLFQPDRRRGRRSGPTGPQVVIQADPEARALVIQADEQTFRRIEDLARRLDADSTAGAVTRTLIPLEHAQADSVAVALEQAFRPRRGQRVAAEDLVTIVPEPGSNSLIVTANEPNLKKVQALLSRLDDEQIGGVRTELLLLQNARADDLAGVLSRVAGATGGRRARQGRQQTPGLSVAAEHTANALVITGPAHDVTRLMQMARQLDQAADAGTTGVFIIPLTTGQAEQTAEMIRDLYRQQLQLARRGGRQPEPLAVTADTRANALVLAASREMHRQVEQWVTQVEGMKPARGRLQIIPLQHADPDDVKRAIDQMLNGNTAPNRRRGRNASDDARVEVSVLPRQRAVMVSAPEDLDEQIARLIVTLEETAEKSRRKTQIITLQNAPNQRVVQALQQVYRQGGRVPEDERISITALPDSNAVVIAAPKEKLAEIEHLISQLDMKDIAPQLAVRIYRLQNAQPDKVLPTLRQMLRQIQRVNPGQTIGVQADQRTGSIIVTAPGEVFEQVQSMIDLLDQAPAFAEADVLIVPLQRADATRLAQVLSDMLRPSPDRQVTPEARALQEQIRRLRVRSTVKEDIPPLDLTQPIKITADPARPAGSNSLILSSTPENLKALAAIVEVLDTVPVAPGVAVKLIHLQNADAQSVEDILRKVFTQGKRLAGTPGTPAQGRAEPETTAGKALVRELNVSADPRTNSLILAGEEEVIALAELLVADMDKQQGKIYTDIRLFRLKHADANRLAPLLQSVFSEARAAGEAKGVQTHVTRLRTYLQKKTAGNDAPEKQALTTDWPKARPALSIRADAGTNILIVAARSDVMPLIADVVNSMDIPGAGSLNSVRIFPLTHADASRLSQVFQNLYRGPNARLVRDEDKPTIAIDTRTNALIISGSEKTFSMLATLIKQLDKKTPVAFRDLRLIALKNAEASALASTLQKMMDARVQRQQSLGVKDAEALRTIIAADARSNSLLVGGSAESFQIVQEIARQLDSAGPALGGQVQIFPLAEGNAGAIAQTLQNLFERRYQAARTPDVRRQKPVLLPDVRTNSLLVAATADDTEILKSLLDRLDVKLTDPSVRLTVLPLEHNDAATVGPTLQRLFAARLRSMTPQGQPPTPQDRVDIATDGLANALIVSASKENLELIRGLLRKVDVEPPDETGVVRLYPLQHADAQRIATLLQGLLREGLYKPGLVVTGQNPAVQGREKVSLAVDTRTNTLIVSASKQNFAIVEEILGKLDTAEDFGSLGKIRVFVLKQANATHLASMLQQFFGQKLAAERQTGAAGRALPTVIISDPRTNALLVAGSRESFADIEAMISRLDTDATAPASTFEIFPLKKASASTVQRMLQQLFDQRATRGGTREKITVIADRRSESVIVGAPPAEMDTVRSLIQRVDEQSPGQKPTEVFPLEHADAKAVQGTLRQLYRSQGGSDTDLSIGVDERSNALVISGENKDLQRVSDILAQLDRKDVKRVTEIKVFPLANADAEELAQMLTSVLTESPKAPGNVNANRQTLLQFIGQTAQGEELITSALQEGVLITPDRRTNALVVSAPLENMPLLGNLIRSLDSTSPRSAQIKVFKLRNADATQMAAVLEQLFRAQEQVGPGRKNPAVQYKLATTRPAGNDAPPAEARATTGSAEQYALSITVDVRTNSLLVGGTKFQVEMAGAIIQELDSSPAQERMTRVYRPKHADPTNIEKALRAFLDQERQRLQQVLGQNRIGAAQRLLEREVAVVAEPNSNTLLISASPRYFDTLATMIDELDRMPPQVLIQALLAEVLLDDETDLGIDWNYTVRRNDSDVTWGDNFGVEASVTGGTPPIGFNVAITGGDLRFFLRALQAQNRLEVLSRPQILAADNQNARIQIGQRVPLITSSRVTDQGDTINTVTYEDVGVSLDVLPRIGSDGQIQLEVKPELSSVSGSSTPLSEFARAQFINSRSAKTTVNCYDGQTVIIGGLITTTDEDREEKIPVLGDIPLVGLLFRSTSKVKDRNELMIFLTPRVLRNENDTLEATREELKYNKTMKTLKRNHSFKKDIIRDLQPEALKEEIRRGSNRLPRTILEKRTRNLRKTLSELELAPADWSAPEPVEETGEDFEREVE